MAKHIKIEEIFKEAEKSIDFFNKKNKYQYSIIAKRGFFILCRNGIIGKLKFNRETKLWGFSIYSYSDNCYLENAFFPGVELLDGTLEGAMKAGLEAYKN
jgi:hypothetical protein